MFNLSTLSGINLQTDNYFQYTSLSTKLFCVPFKTPKSLRQNAKEFKTKRLYVLMQTSLRFISNVLAFEIKRKGVFSSAFFTLLFMLELCPYKDFLITCN